MKAKNHAARTFVTILGLLVFSTNLMAEFKMDKDVSYGPHQRNVLDVYWSTKFKNAPIVFTIHGGGFKNGSKAYCNKDMIKLYMSKGCIVVSPNYRLVGKGEPVTKDDCAMDAAMGMEALGLVKFGDKGNMTRPEIDILVNFLIKKKKEGHFRAFWETFGQSVNLMVSGEVVLQSMWSPAVTAVKAEGVPCIYASPKEGMRGWHGALAISAKTSGKKLDQAYEYLNWWLDGWAGAFVARQGYYLSTPANTKKSLSAEEWDFWYEGKPAARELPHPFGSPLIAKGDVRDGGSYEQRFKKIAVWNSVMTENDYLVKRWTEFLSA